MGSEIKAAALIQGKITLKNAAEAVNCLHKDAMLHCRAGLDKARQGGKLLAEAKAAIRYGAFEKWVESECDFSVETARRYIRLHENWDELLEQYGSTVSAMTLTEGIKKISQAKAATRPAAEQSKPSESRKDTKDEDTECFKGGRHNWEHDSDGEYCSKCHIERPTVESTTDEDIAGHSDNPPQTDEADAAKEMAERNARLLLAEADRLYGRLTNVLDELKQASPLAAWSSAQESLHISYDDFRLGAKSR